MRSRVFVRRRRGGCAPTLSLVLVLVAAVAVLFVSPTGPVPAAVATGGKVYTSADGWVWTEETSGIAKRINGVASSGARAAA